MIDCLFCKIVRGELDCAKIWEDKDFLAILDINPNTKGMTLVLTKKHYDSYAFDMPNAAYKKLMLTSRNVAKLLEKAFNISRVALVMRAWELIMLILNFTLYMALPRSSRKHGLLKKNFLINIPAISRQC